MTTFRALVATKGETGPSLTFADFAESDLMEGDVTVAVEATTVNYKDGLAITGKAPVVRRWPLGSSRPPLPSMPAWRPSSRRRWPERIRASARKVERGFRKKST